MDNIIIMRAFNNRRILRSKNSNMLSFGKTTNNKIYSSITFESVSVQLHIVFKQAKKVMCCKSYHSVYRQHPMKN